MILKTELYRNIVRIVSEIENSTIDIQDEGYVKKSMRELGLSSLDALLVLMKVEERYGVEFDLPVNSIEEIVLFLEDKGVNVNE